MADAPIAISLILISTDLSFRQSIGLALIGGLVSLLLAAASGFIAYLTASSNFKRELQRIREQINVQKEVEQREQIVALKQKYLAPLRYYAQILGLRFEELKNKFTSEDDGRVRNWFKQIKDHVTRDNRMDQYGTWCCYEGVFSVSTIYYTFCYFQCVRELMAHVPFREIRPSYSLELEEQLAKVARAFVWNNGEEGIWEPLQEVIGDSFTTAQDVRMTYAEMCRDQDAGDAFRRAPYLRPLDFYWGQLKPEKVAEIQVALNELLRFLDSRDPQTSARLERFLPAES